MSESDTASLVYSLMLLVLVGSALISATGDPLMPAYYMMAACLVGLVALHYMPETAGRSLRDDPFRR